MNGCFLVIGLGNTELLRNYGRERRQAEPEREVSRWMKGKSGREARRRVYTY